MTHKEKLQLSTVQGILWSGRQFADCYIQLEGRHRGRGYLLLMPTETRLGIRQPELSNEQYRSRVWTIDVGGMKWLAIECRQKFLKLLANFKSEDCRRIFYYLKSVLTEEDIKSYYYPIWLIENNIRNAGQNEHLVAELKRKPKGNSYIHNLTKGTGFLNSVRAHARSSIT